MIFIAAKPCESEWNTSGFNPRTDFLLMDLPSLVDARHLVPSTCTIVLDPGFNGLAAHAVRCFAACAGCGIDDIEGIIPPHGIVGKWQPPNCAS
eukprot:5886688-Pleurochrysis_carterae.AAC.1